MIGKLGLSFPLCMNHFVQYSLSNDDVNTAMEKMQLLCFSVLHNWLFFAHYSNYIQINYSTSIIYR